MTFVLSGFADEISADPGEQLATLAAESITHLELRSAWSTNVADFDRAQLAKFRDAEKLTFPLLSDPDRKVLSAYGAFGEKKMYGKVVQGVIRSTLVVDDKGKIAEAQYNVKATGHVAKLRRDLSV